MKMIRDIICFMILPSVIAYHIGKAESSYTAIVEHVTNYSERNPGVFHEIERGRYIKVITGHTKYLFVMAEDAKSVIRHRFND